MLRPSRAVFDRNYSTCAQKNKSLSDYGPGRNMNSGSLNIYSTMEVITLRLHHHGLLQSSAISSQDVLKVHALCFRVSSHCLVTDLKQQRRSETSLKERTTSQILESI